MVDLASLSAHGFNFRWLLLRVAAPGLSVLGLSVRKRRGVGQAANAKLAKPITSENVTSTEQSTTATLVSRHRRRLLGGSQGGGNHIFDRTCMLQ
jgi:hypothetical protein